MLSKKNSGSFIKKNIVFMVCAALLLASGTDNKNILVLTLAVIVTGMLFSSNEHRFCWSLFLVPSIRIFDGLGFTYMINILFVIPMIFYLLDSKPDKPAFALIGAFVLLGLEIMHKLIYGESFADLVGWVLAFMWCCYATLDKNINVDKSDATYALASGVIFSGVLFIINDPFFKNNFIKFITTGRRFEAYASDPNAYSTYLCLALSSLIIKKDLKTLDLAFMIVLSAIGLLTASKMCIILLTISIAYFLVKTMRNFNNNIIKTVIIIIILFGTAYYFQDIIMKLIEKVLNRTSNSKGNVSLNSLTSNRYKIQMNYLDILFNDPQTFFLGRGFSYYKHLVTVTSQQAHNTYLDIILSWGVVGVVIFPVVLFRWISLYKHKLHTMGFKPGSLFPVGILLLNFFALSLLSAGMFFFIVSFCILQLEPQIHTAGEKR